MVKHLVKTSTECSLMGKNIILLDTKAIQKKKEIKEYFEVST